MRSVTRLATGDGFALEERRMRSGTRAWWPRETMRENGMVFVQRGTFGLRLRGWSATVNPITAFATAAGDQQRIAHQVGALDVCTVLTFDRPLLAELTDGYGHFPDQPIYVSARTALEHRMLIRHVRHADGDGFALAERVLALAVAVLRQSGSPAARSEATASATARAHRAIAHDARDLLVTDPVGTSLAELARTLDVSSHHLSRLFRRYTGQTLSQFRTELRLQRALERIEAGEPNLARLAADLGFADHAHLTRSLRDRLGYTPTALRRLLAETAAVDVR